MYIQENKAPMRTGCQCAICGTTPAPRTALNPRATASTPSRRASSSRLCTFARSANRYGPNFPDQWAPAQGGDQPKISGGPARPKKVKKCGPYGQTAPIRGGKRWSVRQNGSNTRREKVVRRGHRWSQTGPAVSDSHPGVYLSRPPLEPPYGFVCNRPCGLILGGGVYGFSAYLRGKRKYLTGKY